MRRCARGSQACESAPCWDTMRSGPNARRQVRDEPADGPKPRVGAGERLERHVDDGAGRRPLPDLVGIARAREEVATGLVQRHGQHAGIGGVDHLDAVTVVDVEVDVQDAKAVAPGPGDREGRIVVDAEPRRPIRHGVMEPTARVERVLGVPAQDRLDGPQGPTGHGRAGLVHPGEGRVVAAVADARGAGSERIAREPLDGLDVGGRVAPLELRVGGRLRREPRLRPDRPQQVQPRPEPPRRQRMVRPEVVVGGPRSVHEEHAPHDSADASPLDETLGGRCLSAASRAARWPRLTRGSSSVRARTRCRNRKHGPNPGRSPGPARVGGELHSTDHRARARR